MLFKIYLSDGVDDKHQMDVMFTDSNNMLHAELSATATKSGRNMYANSL